MARKKRTSTAMKKVIALAIIFMFLSVYFSYNTLAGDPPPTGGTQPGTTTTCKAECGPGETPGNTCNIPAIPPATTPTEGTFCIPPSTVTCEEAGGLGWVPKEKCATPEITALILTEFNFMEVIKPTNVPSDYICCGALKPEAVKELNAEIAPSWAGSLASGAIDKILDRVIPSGTPDPSEVGNPQNPPVNIIGKSPTEIFIEKAYNVVAIVLGVTRTMMIIIGGGDKNYGTCKAEKPIMGLDKTAQEKACKSCNSDPLRLCTEERCKVLGNCISIAPESEEEQANYICIPGKCDETGLVNMEWINATFYAGGVETKNKKESTNQLNVGEVAWNSDTVKVSIDTKILGQCKYSFEAQSEFASMTDFDDNYYPGTYDNPGVQEVIIPLPGDMARGEQHTIYIKCNNVCGIAHEKTDDNRFVRFNFQAKPDQLPPVIIATDPVNYGAVSGNLTTLVVGFQLDEKGYCKYSDNWTKKDNVPVPLTTKWEDMVDFRENVQNPGSAVVSAKCGNIKCEQLRNQDCTYCNLTLDMSKGFSNISWDKLPIDMQKDLDMNEISKFFHFEIRCADLPQGNVMLEEDTLDYNFFTVPGYSIKLVKPEQGEATYDVHPLISITSTRNTECKYKVSKAITCPGNIAWSEMFAVDDVFGKEHNGNVQDALDPSVQGTSYCMYVKCRDAWTLERTAFATFKLYKDTKAPFVARVYHDTLAGDYLLFETNEESTCKYSIDDEKGCNYDYNEGTDMTGVNETMHTSYWTLEHLFYVKCVDIWGNYPGNSPTANTCTAIINPFEVPEIPR